MTQPQPSQSTASPTTEPEQAVVIFDGVCGLCNTAVDFILRRDIHERFLFAPNQSHAAQELLLTKNLDPTNVDTIYLYKNGVMHHRSTAIVEILGDLPQPWRFGAAFRLVPAPIRDRLYTFVAANRYRWFSKRETCRIPTPDERARFLS